MSNKLTTGIFLALLFAGAIIVLIEKEWSFLQFFIGLILFLLPSMFLSSFKNTLGIFIWAVGLVLLGYISVKYEYWSVILGAVNGFGLGFFIHYYKTSKATVVDIKKIKKH